MKSQNVTKNQMTAARLLAEDKLSDEQIAAKCKVERRTLARWKKQAGFAAAVDKLKASEVVGASKAAEAKGFDTVARLIELARIDPKRTNGTITGQVKACGLIAEIRQEIVKLHGDVTDRLRGKGPDELAFIAVHRRDPETQEELERFVSSMNSQGS